MSQKNGCKNCKNKNRNRHRKDKQNISISANSAVTIDITPDELKNVLVEAMLEFNEIQIQQKEEAEKRKKEQLFQQQQTVLGIKKYPDHNFVYRHILPMLNMLYVMIRFPFISSNELADQSKESTTWWSIILAACDVIVAFLFLIVLFLILQMTLLELNLHAFGVMHILNSISAMVFYGGVGVLLKVVMVEIRNRNDYGLSIAFLSVVVPLIPTFVDIIRSVLGIS